MTEQELEVIWDWWRELDDPEQEYIIIKAYKQWIKFGVILGNLFSPIFLFIIFFLIITPIGILLKIINKDVMGLKKKNSYWINRENELQTMKKQF